MEKPWILRKDGAPPCCLWGTPSLCQVFQKSKPLLLSNWDTWLVSDGSANQQFLRLTFSSGHQILCQAFPATFDQSERIIFKVSAWSLWSWSWTTRSLGSHTSLGCTDVLKVNKTFFYPFQVSRMFSRCSKHSPLSPSHIFPLPGRRWWVFWRSTSAWWGWDAMRSRRRQRSQWPRVDLSFRSEGHHTKTHSPDQLIALIFAVHFVHQYHAQLNSNIK